MENEPDNTPQALFVKEIIRRERPELTEEQVEQLWQEKLSAAMRELGEGDCTACSG